MTQKLKKEEEIKNIMIDALGTANKAALKMCRELQEELQKKNERLKRCAEAMDSIEDSLSQITSGNLSHKIGNARNSLMSLSHTIKRELNNKKEEKEEEAKERFFEKVK